MGKITRWLPADGEDIALWHVVHDADGDEEDLEEHEAKQALDDYAEHQLSAKEIDLPQPQYTNKYVTRKADRLTTSSLGVLGARSELLELENSMQPSLNSHGSDWKRGGDRDDWLVSCKHTESAVELAQLLLEFEESIHKLQSVPEVAERKPWRTDGHPFIGKPTRRFFPVYGASDGVIVGWLPAEGEDPPLWHMVHGDDADEEDLDEQEVNFAMRNFAESRTEMTQEEHDYNESYQAAHEEPPEDDFESEDEDGSAWVAQAAAVARAAKPGIARKRLWSSAECRERWQAALRSAHSAAVVALAIEALRHHCSAFGLVPVDPKAKQKKEDREFQLSSWVHATAFGLQTNKHGKKKK